jgi:hypothetical protein
MRVPALSRLFVCVDDDDTITQIALAHERISAKMNEQAHLFTDYAYNSTFRLYLLTSPIISLCEVNFSNR